ncbi:PfkB family carbohydrate kinase [Kribbella sp. CA-253562]|uniref:PfkB family carbohydrate kinase n=1 Tax=Kribbella sp. CA-253562 TaxID=3239942 RepID=UPI003D8DC7D4
MAERTDRATKDAVLRALKTLRKGHGIPTPDSLRAKLSPGGPMANLPAVRQLRRNGSTIDEAVAIHRVVVEAVAEMTNALHRLIADTVLALHNHLPAYSPAIEVTPLTAPTLLERRAAVRDQWQVLHRLTLGTEAGAPPSDGQLRRIIEETALAELADRLLITSLRGFGSPIDAPGSEAARRGKVIVVGGVAMDITFRIEDFPDHETSTQASSLRITPGGKGFMQAIAAARLGLDTALLAAIAADEHQDRIVEQLEDAGVDTSLLKVVDDDHSNSFTGIFELTRGDSRAVNLRGTAKLTPDDITAAAPRLAACNAILATFEVPPEITRELLTLTSTFPPTGPAVVLTPGQPYVEGEKLDRRLLAQVDYLVGRRWEFTRLFSDTHPELLGDDLYEYLLDLGVKHVCLMNDHGSSVYSSLPEPIHETQPHAYTFPNSAISRDAFCAALAYRLCEDTATLDDAEPLTEAIRWATAAMARAASEFTASAQAGDESPAVNSLPSRTLVEEKLRAVRRRTPPR